MLFFDTYGRRQFLNIWPQTLSSFYVSNCKKFEKCAVKKKGGKFLSELNPCVYKRNIFILDLSVYCFVFRF